MISVNSGGVKIQKYLWIQHLWIKRDKVSTVEVSPWTSKIIYSEEEENKETTLVSFRTGRTSPAVKKNKHAVSNKRAG